MMKKPPVDILDSDVLILGGGGAGMMAALAASQKGCRVTLVDKGIPGKQCATLMAKQLAASGPWSFPHDSPEKHRKDTLVSGCFINNRALVEVFVNQAASTIQELEAMGMLFEREASGKTFLSGGQPPGHSYPRSLTYKETTGRMIIDALRRQVVRREIQMLSDRLVTRLLVEDGMVRGASVWNVASGEMEFIQAKTIVLATGGCGQIYPITSNPEQSTGEGYVLGFEAGAALEDMEMFQFYPVSLVYPRFLRGLNINFRGRLLNSRMERFMEKIDPVNLENVTRDKLSQGVYREIKKGLSSPHGGVYLQAADFDPAYYQRRYPTEYGYCLEAGIDLKSDLVEVAPAAHFMMGGLRIDPRCRTDIEGLFAAGEVSGGLHGANRLANNALMEIFVFGKIAGQEAGGFALRQETSSLSPASTDEAAAEIQQILEPKREAVRGVQFKEMIRPIMWEKVGVIRRLSELKEGIERLKEIQETLVPKLGADLSHKTYNRDILEALEARSMVRLALLIAQSASIRRESRGAQYLEDVPEQNDRDYLKNVVVRKGAGRQAEFSLRTPDS